VLRLDPQCKGSPLLTSTYTCNYPCRHPITPISTRTRRFDNLLEVTRGTARGTCRGLTVAYNHFEVPVWRAEGGQKPVIGRRKLLFCFHPLLQASRAGFKTRQQDAVCQTP